MSPPTAHELKDMIITLLSDARDEGRLSELTVRIVREELVARFGFDEDDVLGDGTYKSFIKETVHAAVNASEEVSPKQKAVKKDEDEDNDKEKSGRAKKTGSSEKRARRTNSKAKVQASDEQARVSADASERDGALPPPKKAKSSARPKVSKPAKFKKVSKKPESEVHHKSKAIIESSDDEAAPDSGTRKAAPSPKKEQTSRNSPPPKRKQDPKKADKDDSDVEMSTDQVPGPSSSSSKPMHLAASAKAPASKANKLAADPMESELSSVIDEPPKKRQKKQEKEPVKVRNEEKMKRGKKETLSKDEEMVNKLKGIIVACGVRKVWKKEFEGLDKPSQQIKRLHSILGELGMTPRYSLEKAKAIKEERELAQELKDVQEFEKATKKRGKGRRQSDARESTDQNDSDEDVPARGKNNARTSIMAFLQDQSDED